MGHDNSPKLRQVRKLERKQARRANYDRILTVTEGSRTEPLYLRDFRAFYRLHSANVQVYPSQLGTAPLQVVQYAQQLFENGDAHKGIRPKSFEQVYAVFDRDDHKSYFDALNLAKSLQGQLKNEDKETIIFQAVPSVPCFELWLLLHYEEVKAPLSRYEVIQRLKKYIPKYEKGCEGVFEITREYLPLAIERANRLAVYASNYDGEDEQPNTALGTLVSMLQDLHLKL